MGTATMDFGSSSELVGLRSASAAAAAPIVPMGGGSGPFQPTPMVVVSVPSPVDSVDAAPITPTFHASMGPSKAEEDGEEDFDEFDDLELGSDDQHVPLGEILEKLDDANEAGSSKGNSSSSSFIRLHAVSEGSNSNTPTTISATLNVSTLDLSDPESIHRHLSQLNDTVLKVSTATLSLRSIQQTSLSPAEQTDSSPTSSGYLSSPHHPVIASPTSPSQPLTLSISPLPPAASSSSSAPCTPTHQRRLSASPGGGGGSKTSPQVCSICSKTFSNASALAKHRLTHSEERRYQCTICGKAFKRQDHLNGHLLTHRSTKPFACLAEGCGKSYCDARSLRRHKENHHSLAKGSKTISGGSLVSENGDTRDNDNSNDESSSLVDSSSKQPRPGLVVNTKGLSPQQVQLIEQLFKESNNLTSIDTTASTITSSPSNKPVKLPSPSKKSDASVTASSIAAKALAAVQNQAFHLSNLDVSPNNPDGGNSSSSSSAVMLLAEKPVECTMCSRKFKNIPALNGHMRLHGGYYKKDAEGKRILNTTDKSSATRTEEVGRKRKSPVKLGSTPNKLSPAAIKLLQQQQTSPPSLPSPTPPTATVEEAKPQLTFRSLPAPDTKELLANLERKNQAPIASLLQHTPEPKISSHSSSNSSSLMQMLLPTVPILPNGFTRMTESGSTVASSSCHLHPKATNLMKVNAETDKTPKVGLEHQADIPDDLGGKSSTSETYDRSELLWDPRTAAKLTSSSSSALQSYLTLSSSCLVPGGSRNEETALEALQKHSGNAQQALLSLMTKKEPRAWTETEINSFYECLVKHHKDFRSISLEVGTRSVRECVEYYYLWKNMCREESQSFKTIFSSSNSQSIDGVSSALDEVNALKSQQQQQLQQQEPIQ